MITKADIGQMVEPCQGHSTYGYDVRKFIGWEEDTNLPILINRHGVKHNCFPEDFFVVNIQFDQVPEEYRSKCKPKYSKTDKSKETKTKVSKPKETKQETNIRTVSPKDMMYNIINK